MQQLGNTKINSNKINETYSQLINPENQINFGQETQIKISDVCDPEQFSFEKFNDGREGGSSDKQELLTFEKIEALPKGSEIESLGQMMTIGQNNKKSLGSGIMIAKQLGDQSLNAYLTVAHNGIRFWESQKGVRGLEKKEMNVVYQRIDEQKFSQILPAKSFTYMEEYKQYQHPIDGFDIGLVWFDKEAKNISGSYLIKEEEQFEKLNVQPGDSIQLVSYPVNMKGTPCNTDAIIQDLNKMKNGQIIMHYDCLTTNGQCGCPIFLRRNNKKYLIGIHLGIDEENERSYGVAINEQTRTWITNQFEKKIVLSKLEEEDLDLIFTSTMKKESFKIFYDYMYNRNGNLDIATQVQILYHLQKDLKKQLKILIDKGEAYQFKESDIKGEIKCTNINVLYFCLQELAKQNKQKLYFTKAAVDVEFGLHQIIFNSFPYYQVFKLKILDNKNKNNESQLNNKMYYYDEIIASKQSQMEFIYEISCILSKIFNVPYSSIQIIAIEKGSTTIIYEIRDLIYKHFQQIKELEVSKHFSQKIEFSQKPLLKHIVLKPEYFNPEFNMEWPTDHMKKEERGPPHHLYNYFFPIEWYGCALNIQKYDNGDLDWIQMDGNENEWRILYHGTRQLDFAINIVKEGFKPGERNAYEDDQCILTKKKVGIGIYFSNHIEVANDYANSIQLENKKFHIVFQSRANPEAIRQCKKEGDCIEYLGDPDWDNDYFVVNEPRDVRPYRILIKESN